MCLKVENFSPLGWLRGKKFSFLIIVKTHSRGFSFFTQWTFTYVRLKNNLYFCKYIKNKHTLLYAYMVFFTVAIDGYIHGTSILFEIA